ncbi:MAG: DoxX family membrane protein, partial [Phaeodactylibacter sp.]|nr:DoxX family membrane protein [Phaeodactylibacter sp.]
MGLGPEISLALATFAEVGCALLVILGLFTRWATAPLAITMMVAISANLGEGFG